MKRSGAFTALLLALILIVAALGATAAWAPLATCPSCRGEPLLAPEFIPKGTYFGAMPMKRAPREFRADQRRVSWLQKRRRVSSAIPVGTEFLPPSR